MQRHSSNENNIKIPPNLLKNFNVYDILEPEKNGAKNSDATKVDKLVDIDDCSQDSGFQDSDLDPVFLDKNRDFDLVDLYQNIFVTPQHIKNKEEASETDDADATFSGSKFFDAGFQKFFDMLESGQKIDWTKIAQKEEEAETITKHPYIEKKPRVLVPKALTGPDSDSEDIIDEVLIQKKMEKLFLGNISNSSIESQERESPKRLNNTNAIPELSRFSINGITKDSKFESGCIDNVPRRSEFETCRSDSESSNSTTTFTVQAIQKDEKVYKKKRILKPESQTANYTEGPDFYEKSVVLPQIMARLHARLVYLDEKGNHKKRLILDGGAKSECSSSNVQVKSKPNREVTNTLNVREEFSNQARCSMFTKNGLTKMVVNNASGSGIHSLKLNNVGIKKEANKTVGAPVKTDTVHRKMFPLPSSNKANSPVAASTKAEYGKLSPVVLLEDCNKERLRALKQSQMFKDFVLKGKYEL